MEQGAARHQRPVPELAPPQMNRLIAYDWFECGKPHTGFINWAEECKTSEKGEVTLAGKHL